MNRFLFLIASALVGILVSSCAPIPRQGVPKYGSHSGAPHYLPLRHPPRRAVVHDRMPHVTDHHRHAQRRATSEGQRRPLHPWDHLPAASETRALRNATTPPIRITSRQTPMSRHPLLPTRSGHRIIGAGRSDPSSKVHYPPRLVARPQVRRRLPAGLVREVDVRPARGRRRRGR
jgi:hypothetical protein